MARLPIIHLLLSLAGWLITSLAVFYIYLLIVNPGLRFWNGIVTHGSSARPMVALTFDDGPHPLWAPLLADTLERHKARGTFFLVGMEAQLYPEITTRLALAGHQIGNHSLTHPYPNLTFYPESRTETEITGAAKLLKQITGHPVLVFRPPGGGMDDMVLETARVEGMHIAWWSTSANDWMSSAPGLTIWCLQHELQPGSVMLLHERGNTVQALERFLSANSGNYRFETFSSVTQQ